jgi:tripeptidyl-peptidase-1
MQGQVKGTGGTSLSSPIFAATIALLNDKLYAAGKHPEHTDPASRLTSGIGKAPLGFLNPWLYKNAGMLNDIKDGEFLTCFPISPILNARSRFHDR